MNSLDQAIVAIEPDIVAIAVFISRHPDWPSVEGKLIQAPSAIARRAIAAMKKELNASKFGP